MIRHKYTFYNKITKKDLIKVLNKYYIDKHIACGMSFFYYNIALSSKKDR